MNRTLRALTVGLVAALTLSLASIASAATTTPTSSNSPTSRTLQLRYCWQTTVFSPRCPGGPLVLAADGSVSSLAGSSWTETATTLVLDFVNPTPSVAHVVYSGTRMSGTTQTCYAGTMTATRVASPAMTGVWQGCIVY